MGHILRRNCLLKRVIERKIEGRIEVTGRRGRRRKQLLDNLKEKRWKWKLKEELLDRRLWKRLWKFREIVTRVTPRSHHRTCCTVVEYQCVCLSVRLCTRARVLMLMLSFFFSGGKFISIGEKIRLPDDVTMGYIIGEFCSQNFVLVSCPGRVAAKGYCA
jgi:hypothetical protein